MSWSRRPSRQRPASSAHVCAEPAAYGFIGLSSLTPSERTTRSGILGGGGHERCGLRVSQHCVGRRAFGLRDLIISTNQGVSSTVRPALAQENEGGEGQSYSLPAAPLSMGLDPALGRLAYKGSWPYR